MSLAFRLHHGLRVTPIRITVVIALMVAGCQQRAPAFSNNVSIWHHYQSPELGVAFDYTDEASMHLYTGVRTRYCG